MLTMAELLNDSKLFKIWMMRQPKLNPIVNPDTAFWKLYVQRSEGGGWAVKEIHEYEQGLQLVLKNLDNWHDLALHSRKQQFSLPRIIRNAKTYTYTTPAGHVWCNYCRRPTVFKRFAKHHAFPKRYQLIITDEKRCTICGIQRRALDKA